MWLFRSLAECRLQNMYPLINSKKNVVQHFYSIDCCVNLGGRYDITSMIQRKNAAIPWTKVFLYRTHFFMPKINYVKVMYRIVYLLEANVSGVFPEALAANVQAIFADKTMFVGARPAVTDIYS